MRSIGLIGHARAGKDTAAYHLVRGYGYQRVAIADPVRDSLLALNPIVKVDAWCSPELAWAECICEPSCAPDAPIVCTCDAGGPTYGADVHDLSEIVHAIGWERAKDEVPEIRRLLQAYASEAMRDIVGPDVWLTLALRKVHAAHERGGSVVVTDVRFPNEAQALRALGVRLIYIRRPGTEPANGHVSDQALSHRDADVTIVNDGTVENLWRSIEEFVSY